MALHLVIPITAEGTCIFLFVLFLGGVIYLDLDNIKLYYKLFCRE
jgi:hypothetical protein